MSNLSTTLEEVRRCIARTGSRAMNEENTKALIKPFKRFCAWQPSEASSPACAKFCDSRREGV